MPSDQHDREILALIGRIAVALEKIAENTTKPSDPELTKKIDRIL